MRSTLYSIASSLGLAAMLLATAGPLRAGVVFHTNQASYASAMALPGAASSTDSFNDLSAGALLSGPLQRGAGSGAYTISVNDVIGAGPGNGAEDFFPVDLGGGNSALSLNFAGNDMVFSGFSSATRGIGGFMFGSDESGALLPGARLRLAVTDADGSYTELITPIGLTDFFGFTSTSAISGFSLSAIQPSSGFNWAVVDDLLVSQVQAQVEVPEPGSLALFLLGLMGAGTISMRRRR
jgi:hypothetical protein